MDNGFKETENKLNYELDWDFISALAKRMSSNKDKYPAYNWQLPINVEELKQSLFRHTLEVMKGNYKDKDEELGHIIACALNAMFIFYQENNNKNET
jgi:hypothetical protein